MTETLQIVESIQRTGYTVIDGVRVAQHTCTISTENPEKMHISMVRLNPDMYRLHRDICRRDFAAFEDAAYALQDEYINKLKE